MKILKKGGMLLLAAVISISIQAQKASVETASIALRTYNKTEEKKEVRIHNLKEAKKHVDMAFSNSTTSNDPKMWLMRARTYLAIQTDKLGEEGKSCITDRDAIATASEAIINCHKVDTKQKYSRSRDAYEAFVGIAVNAQNIAVNSYNEKDYKRAIKYYQIPRDLIPHDDQSLIKRQNITSDGLLNSIAYTEYQDGNYEDAKKHYNELIDKSYNDPLIYIDLYQIYLEKDLDTNKAIETINKGRMAFDENAALKYQQINVYYKSGRANELLQILSDNIEDDPYNSENYLLRGKLYRSVSEDSSTTEEFKNAIADFEKAIEMDDQNLEAHNELGELYYIAGADILEEANALGFNENEKFEKLNAEAKESFKKAIPSWEVIYNYSTDEKESGKAAQFLKQLYLKTEQMDKYKKLKGELGQ